MYLHPPVGTALVLEALVSDPYEPLECSSLKALSFKTVLLLALTSAKRVSELCALSAHPNCLVLRGNHSSVTLRQNPSFVPENMSSFRSRTMFGRHVREAKLHLLCPVRALACYVEHTAPSVQCTAVHVLW